MTERACTGCGHIQPDEAFPLWKGRRSGKCLSCIRKKRRGWRQARGECGPPANPLTAKLSSDHWTTVARCVRITSEVDGWEWSLKPREVTILDIGVTHRSIIKARAKEPDGTLVIKARLALGPKRQGEAFAIAGLDLFEEDGDGMAR